MAKAVTAKTTKKPTKSAKTTKQTKKVKSLPPQKEKQQSVIEIVADDKENYCDESCDHECECDAAPPDPAKVKILISGFQKTVDKLQNKFPQEDVRNSIMMGLLVSSSVAANNFGMSFEDFIDMAVDVATDFVESDGSYEDDDESLPLINKTQDIKLLN